MTRLFFILGVGWQVGRIDESDDWFKSSPSKWSLILRKPPTPSASENR
jgi:hypothetical protein